MAIPFQLLDSGSRQIHTANDYASETYIGLKMPLQNSSISGSLGYFESTKYSIDAITQNVKNLLVTQKGERIFNIHFGVNWNKFLFEQYTTDTESHIRSEIVSSITSYLPFLTIARLQISHGFNNIENSIHILLIISYNQETIPIQFQMVGANAGAY